MTLLDKGPFVSTMTSSTASMGGVMIWGLTQAEWAIYIGLGTAFVAVSSLALQLWLGTQKARLYQTQIMEIRERMRRDGVSEGTERQEDDGE